MNESQLKRQLSASTKMISPSIISRNLSRMSIPVDISAATSLLYGTWLLLSGVSSTTLNGEAIFPATANAMTTVSEVKYVCTLDDVICPYTLIPVKYR